MPILNFIKSPSRRVLRFGMVGIINTLFSFILLNLAFYGLGVGKIWANVIATSLALTLSFILNRSFVFKHKGHWLKLFMRFTLVTAMGTLIVNNGIYIISLSILKHYIGYDTPALINLAGIHLGSDFLEINGSAVIATLFGMVWNYTGYRKVVFSEKANDEAIPQIG